MRLARLDGVRGIAIFLVIAHHHYFLSQFGGIGVELFFVLSGYLITRILRGSRSSPTYWQRFYLKRSFRLLPGLLLLLVVVALTTRHISALGFLGYAFFFGDVTNVTPFYIAPLGALWSLAVEEHFYMVWPSCVRVLRRKTLLGIIFATLLLEPILRLLAMHHVSSFWTIYSLTPFRLDSIALGCLLGLLSEDAWISRRLDQISPGAALGFGSAFLLLSIFVPSFRHDSNSVLGNGVGYSVAAIASFFTVAWIISLHPGSLADRLLSVSPLVFLGRISYGVYLFQGVVMLAVAKLAHVPWGQAGSFGERRLLPIDLLLTAGIATAMYYLVESPARRWGSQLTRSLEGRSVRSEQTIAAGGALSGS